MDICCLARKHAAVVTPDRAFARLADGTKEGGELVEGLVETNKGRLPPISSEAEHAVLEDEDFGQPSVDDAPGVR